MPPSPRSFDEKRTRIAALATEPPALALHRHDVDPTARVRGAVTARKSRRIAAIFADRFGS